MTDLVEQTELKTLHSQKLANACLRLAEISKLSSLTKTGLQPTCVKTIMKHSCAFSLHAACGCFHTAAELNSCWSSSKYLFSSSLQKKVANSYIRVVQSSRCTGLKKLIRSCRVSVGILHTLRVHVCSWWV